MFYINKQIGETPLETLREFRSNNPKYKNTRLSYIGRLDPMASGKLLIIEGKENDQREIFLNRDKAYEFQILFGVSTDTFDLLGIPERSVNRTKNEFDKHTINQVLSRYVGQWKMIYPPYSSKTIEHEGGKVPLWQLARNGKLPGILPIKEVEIYKLSCSKIKAVSNSYITRYITENIVKVSGDFRQRQIIDCWRKELANREEFLLADCFLECSSGTYVRRLACEIGRALNVEALAFSITRISA